MLWQEYKNVGIDLVLSVLSGMISRILQRIKTQVLMTCFEEASVPGKVCSQKKEGSNIGIVQVWGEMSKSNQHNFLGKGEAKVQPF
jgi:hypothetical protein